MTKAKPAPREWFCQECREPIKKGEMFINTGNRICHEECAVAPATGGTK